MHTGVQIGFQTQMHVFHRAFDVAANGDAEQIGEPKVFALLSLFVVKRRLKGGQQTATTLDKLPQLNALLVRESSDVRQDQELERSEMLRIKQLVILHLEGYACLDERMIALHERRKAK